MTFLDRMIAEVKQLLANAEYADGEATVLTQDCEALEALVKEIEDRREYWKPPIA